MQIGNRSGFIKGGSNAGGCRVWRMVVSECWMLLYEEKEEGVVVLVEERRAVIREVNGRSRLSGS